MKLLKKYLHFAGKHKQKLKLGIIFLGLSNLAAIASFYAFYVGFHLLLSNILAENLIILFIILLGSIVFQFIFSWLSQINIAGLFFTCARDFRLKMGTRLKQAPMGFFNSTRLTSILTALTQILQGLETYATMPLLFAIQALVCSLVLCLGMFFMHWIVGLLCLVLVMLHFWIYIKGVNGARKDTIYSRKAQVELSDAILEGIRGANVLRAYPLLNDNFKSQVHSQIYNRSREYAKQQFELEKTFVKFNTLFNTLIHISSLLVALLSCYLYTKGMINTTMVLTVTVAANMLFMSLSPLVNNTILTNKVRGDFDFLENVLDVPNLDEGNIKQSPEDENKRICFENVSFSYLDKVPEQMEENDYVIKDMSFCIEHGSKVAIVGPSGSGKSTIISLIARFWDPQKGRISYGNQDISNYSIRTLLKDLSLVFQDVYLFDDTIANNIRFAKPEATDEEIVEICKRARCHEFIMEMPQGYNTYVGDEGSRLSGGEKQRISIARALLKNADIILLDEATSSVDPENEYEIIAGLEEICEGKTVVSIAHRLSTVRNADKILVINEGRLVQQGTHSELMREEGIYKSFVEAKERSSRWTLV